MLAFHTPLIFLTPPLFHITYGWTNSSGSLVHTVTLYVFTQFVTQNGADVAEWTTFYITLPAPDGLLVFISFVLTFWGIFWAIWISNGVAAIYFVCVAKYLNLSVFPFTACTPPLNMQENLDFFSIFIPHQQFPRAKDLLYKKKSSIQFVKCYLIKVYKYKYI